MDIERLIKVAEATGVLAKFIRDRTLESIRIELYNVISYG